MIIGDLTKRDLALLKTLNFCQILTTSKIEELYFSGKNRSVTLVRLNKLKKRKYLKSFQSVLGGEMVWTLGDASRKYLGYPLYVKKLNRNSLAHDLKANELFLKLKRLDHGYGFLSNFELKSRLSGRNYGLGSWRESIPDWLFSINNRGKHHTIALECEMSYKGKRRMKDIFSRYLARRELSFLWYVVPTAKFKENLFRLYKEVSRGERKSFLLISTFDEFFSNENDYQLSTMDKDFIGSKIFIKSTLPLTDGVGSG